MSRLLIASINRFGPLQDGTRDALATCEQTTTQIENRHPVVRLGERSKLTLLVRGVATRQLTLPDGQRQILGFAVPGDLLDLGGLYSGIDHEVVALGPCEVRQSSARDVARLLGRHTDLLAALSRTILTDVRIQRAWMVSLGRRSAPSRAAHLICEVYTRLASVGQGESGRCVFPVFYSDLADALGLSLVHTSRILQSLARSGLATIRQGLLVIQDWEGLAELADFDASYIRPQHDSQFAAVQRMPSEAPTARQDQHAAG